MAGQRTYADIANDLLQLSAMFAQTWETIEGKVPVTRAQVDEAGQLGDTLAVALARDDIQPERIAFDRRNRAFTLLYLNYEEVRRAVQFVRYWEDDANDYAPSLFAGRRRPRADADADPAVVVSATDPTEGDGDPQGEDPVDPPENE